MKIHRAVWFVAYLCALGCGGKVESSANTAGSGGASFGVAGASSLATGGATAGVAGASNVGKGGAAAGGTAGNATAGSLAAGSATAGGAAGSTSGAFVCPTSEPSEGAACSSAGLTCNGYGTLSCADIAVCALDGTWAIECPEYPAGADPGSCACAHPYGDLRDGGAVRIPTLHRAASSACTTARPPGTIMLQGSCTGPDGGTCPGFECGMDADCTQGVNGRCVSSGPLPGTQCSYDTCTSDSNCANDSPCQCRTEGSTAPNYCVDSSECRIDADCGFMHYCSPSNLNQWCGPSFHCHSPLDTCVDDADCGQSPGGCNFDRTVHHWLCGANCPPLPP